MVRVRKEVWAPGEWRLADGRLWKDTPEDVKNGYEQGKAMLAAGLHVPACWEHQSIARPAYLSERKWSEEAKADYARKVFGHVADYELEGDKLFAVLEVRDQQDADQFLKTRFVSPLLNHNYRDSRDRLWPGKTVGHVAATPVPAQEGQSAAELSRFAEGGKADETVVLSTLEPVGPAETSRALWWWRDAVLSRTPDVNGGRKVDLGKVASLLKRVGIDVGMPRNDGEFMAALEAAVNTKFGAEGDMADTQNDPNTDYANSPPALMSQLPQPVQEGLRANLRAERDGWVRRIDSLFSAGRVNGPIFRELKAKATAAELSYVDGWKVGRADWMGAVEAYEALPEKTFHAGNTDPSELGAELSRATLADRPDVPVKDGDKVEEERLRREEAAAAETEKRLAHYKK